MTRLLGLAAMANDHVRSAVTVANRTEDYVVASVGRAAGLPGAVADVLASPAIAVTSVRHGAVRALNWLTTALAATDPYDIRTIRARASRAAIHGVAQCQECAEMALVFLYDRHVRPLELFGAPSLPHQFVVVNRHDAGVFAGVVRYQDPTTWGAHAVVCDPWARLAIPAMELRSTLGSARLELLCAFTDGA